MNSLLDSNDEKYLTASDAARIAHRSAAAIRSSEHRGELRVFLRTVAGVRIFRESDVREFVRKRDAEDLGSDAQHD